MHPGPSDAGEPLWTPPFLCVSFHQRQGPGSCRDQHICSSCDVAAAVRSETDCAHQTCLEESGSCPLPMHQLAMTILADLLTSTCRAMHIIVLNCRHTIRTVLEPAPR